MGRSYPQQGVMSSYQLSAHTHQGVEQGGILNRYGLTHTNPDTLANVISDLPATIAALLSDHDKIAHDALGIELLGDKVFINETVNTDMTRGITTNIGGANDQAVAWKASAVAHACTDEAEADTFGNIRKGQNSEGGVALRGYSEGGEGVKIKAICTSFSTTKDLTATGSIQLEAFGISGSGLGNVGANSVIVAMRCQRGGTLESVWVVDEDGDTYQHGNLGIGYDQAADCNAYWYEGGTARGRIWYDISGNDFIIDALEDDLWLEANGDVASETIRANTTVTACNVQIGTVIGNIKRSTSGKKYKDKIKDLELDSSLVYSLRPRSFNSLCGDDDKNKRYIGLIADEVEEFYPEIISYGDKKSVENYDSQMLLTLVIAEMQKIHSRVSALEN